MRGGLLGALVALVVCACSPPAPASQSSTQEPVATSAAQPQSVVETPAAPAALASALADGAWAFEEGNAGSIASFGAPDARHDKFYLQCERGPKSVAMSLNQVPSPGQNATLTITTAVGAFDFPAHRGEDDGAPTVSSELTAPDPRLSALAAATDRFAVTGGGETLVLPMHAILRHTLSLCGVK